MTEAQQLNNFQTDFAGLVERAKRARNQFAGARTLTACDAADAAQCLAIVSSDMATLAVRIKQAAMNAAADARRSIK